MSNENKRSIHLHQSNLEDNSMIAIVRKQPVAESNFSMPERLLEKRTFDAILSDAVCQMRFRLSQLGLDAKFGIDVAKSDDFVGQIEITTIVDIIRCYITVVMSRLLY